MIIEREVVEMLESIFLGLGIVIFAIAGSIIIEAISDYFWYFD